MKINIGYKDGEMKVDGTPTKKERKLYQDLKTAAENFYETVEGLLKGKVLEGILEIKVKKGED